MFIDSHCHLDFDAFDPDREAVMQRARDAGVNAFVTISVRVKQFDRVLETALAWPHVYCAVGTLPHYADEETDVTAADLVRIAQHPKVVGIGECGYDRLLGDAPWDDQVKVFAEHIAAARETQLPLIIHSVREDAAMAETLEAETRKGAFPILIHAFSGQRDFADRVLALGAYCSISGLATYPEYEYLRDIVRTLPADRILVETDAPSQNPGADRDGRNEPANILTTAQLVADLRGQTLAELGAQTTENFYRLFTRVPRLTPAA
ncbi:TatD family hydrolase [Devosia sp.]|uniref:TatD family hydrolase n=1 Tax=Devosia sp. TaxID=1871048 RepID=UPI003A92656C